MIAVPNWFDDPPELGMLPQPPFEFAAASIAGTIFYVIVLEKMVEFETDYNLIISPGQTTNVGVKYYSSPWQFLLNSAWSGAAWVPTIVGIQAPPWVGALDLAWLKVYMFDDNTGRLSVPFQRSQEVEIIAFLGGSSEELGEHTLTWWAKEHPERFDPPLASLGLEV